MDIRTAETWEELVSILEDVKNKYGSTAIDPESGPATMPVDILYRGQADKNWPLETTLERKTTKTFTVLNYMHCASSSAAEIESLTGKVWDVPDYPELEAQIRSNSDIYRVELPCYDYLVYLRHHGFPSPLLDWTASPYVAAFFAFQDAKESDPAVYCYIETPNNTKGRMGSDSFITTKGPFVRTHGRHFAQKASYTICTQWDSTQDKHIFVPHESVFSQGNAKQDVLIKIELPNALRKEALNRLHEYNINPFTLFQSEDSLIKSIEIRQFDL